MYSTYRQPSALPPDDGPTFWILGVAGQAKSTAEQTRGAISVVEMLCPPGYATPLHIHYLEDEAIYVLEGQLSFVAGDQQMAAERGSYVFQPRGIAHGFRVEGETPARMLCLSIPGARDQGRPAGAAQPLPLGPAALELERIADLAARHKIDVLGPLPGTAGA